MWGCGPRFWGRSGLRSRGAQPAAGVYPPRPGVLPVAPGWGRGRTLGTACPALPAAALEAEHGGLFFSFQTSPISEFWGADSKKKPKRGFGFFVLVFRFVSALPGAVLTEITLSKQKQPKPCSSGRWRTLLPGSAAVAAAAAPGPAALPGQHRPPRTALPGRRRRPGTRRFGPRFSRALFGGAPAEAWAA